MFKRNQELVFKKFEQKAKIKKFNLQLFAEPNPDPEPPKTFTEEELQQQIAAVVGKERAALDKMQKEKDADIAKAVAAALEKEKNLAKLNDDEKKDLALQEAIEKSAELEKQIKLTSIKSDALKIFQERKLPVELLDFVLTDESDTTLERINSFQSVFKTAVEDALKDKLKGTPPVLGKGESNTSNPWSAESFNLTKQMEIMKSDPALAEQLKSAAKMGKN